MVLNFVLVCTESLWILLVTMNQLLWELRWGETNTVLHKHLSSSSLYIDRIHWNTSIQCIVNLWMKNELQQEFWEDVYCMRGLLSKVHLEMLITQYSYLVMMTNLVHVILRNNILCQYRELYSSLCTKIYF